MDKNTDCYKELEQAAMRDNLTVAEFAKNIVMEDFENAGYSGNDEWFESFTEEAFIETVCKNLKHYKEYYPEYFEDT